MNGEPTAALARAVLAAALERLGDVGRALEAALADAGATAQARPRDAWAAVAERCEPLEEPLRAAGFAAAAAASALGIPSLGARTDRAGLAHLVAFAPASVRERIPSDELTRLTALAAERSAPDGSDAWRAPFALLVLLAHAPLPLRTRRIAGRAALELTRPSAALRDEVRSVDPVATWHESASRAVWSWRLAPHGRGAAAQNVATSLVPTVWNAASSTSA